MKLSIIIPAYNSEKYIERCLESIIKQKYFDSMEILVVNDGSVDETCNILKRYDEKYDNIKIVNLKKNRGQSVARNVGIDMAVGDYVFFVDSDDYIDDHFSEHVFEAISINKGVQIIRISNKIFDEKMNVIKNDSFPKFSNKSGEETIKIMYENNLWIETPWSYVIKKDYLVSNSFKFAEGKLQEDLGIIPIVILKSDNVCSACDAVYYYIIRENSTMTNKDYLHNYNLAYDVLGHYDFLEKEISGADRYASNIIFSIFIRTFIDKLNILSSKDKALYRKCLKNRRVVRKIKILLGRDLLKKIYYYFRLYVF